MTDPSAPRGEIVFLGYQLDLLIFSLLEKRMILAAAIRNQTTAKLKCFGSEYTMPNIKNIAPRAENGIEFFKILIDVAVKWTILLNGFNNKV